jgi:hypothetical protein
MGEGIPMRFSRCTVDFLNISSLRLLILKKFKGYFSDFIDFFLFLAFLPLLILGPVYSSFAAKSDHRRSNRLWRSSKIISKSMLVDVSAYFDVLQQSRNSGTACIPKEFDLHDNSYLEVFVRAISEDNFEWNSWLLGLVPSKVRPVRITIIKFTDYSNDFKKTVLLNKNYELLAFDKFYSSQSEPNFELIGESLCQISDDSLSRILNSDLILLDISRMYPQEREFYFFLTSILPAISDSSKILITGLRTYANESDLWKLKFVGDFSSIDLLEISLIYSSKISVLIDSSQIVQWKDRDFLLLGKQTGFKEI